MLSTTYSARVIAKISSAWCGVAVSKERHGDDIEFVLCRISVIIDVDNKYIFLIKSEINIHRCFFSKDRVRRSGRRIDR